MLLALLKWLKETLGTNGKFLPRRKEEFMNFWIKEKFMLRISGGKKRSFSTQEVGRKKKRARFFKKWKSCISVLKNKNKNDRIFSLAWNIVYWLRKSPWERAHAKEPLRLLRSSSFELYGGGKYSLFWDKKLMERWYLRITEKFLFRAFCWWEIRSFLRQKVNGKMIFPDYWKVLVLNFSLIGNTVLFLAKKLM